MKAAPYLRKKCGRPTLFRNNPTANRNEWLVQVVGVNFYGVMPSNGNVRPGLSYIFLPVLTYENSLSCVWGLLIWYLAVIFKNNKSFYHKLIRPHRPVVIDGATKDTRLLHKDAVSDGR